MNLKGLHHVSSLTADARKNMDFYTRVLGLRLVKKTVNQDNTAYYHLFYGDAKGSPGTELTFFEIPHLAKKHPGTNSVTNISLRVKTDDALVYWQNRFKKLGVDQDPISEEYGHAILPFRDWEGHQMSLISAPYSSGHFAGKAWSQNEIPEEFLVTGLGPVNLTVRYAEPTIQVLTDLMGFKKTGEYQRNNMPHSTVHVFEAGEGGSSTHVHIEQRKDLSEERQGRGSVHHIAFRVANEGELHQWIDHLKNDGLNPSNFTDRFYFRSLYFSEPNGILFELATDGPGLDVDEPSGQLGENLSLPTFLEHRRDEIVAKLKPLPAPRYLNSIGEE
ncbi:ring-cleaving dioxygenase [Metabacillus idriensis]|uniref:ring-cleaving dioxygenase n=1 Tax=Metabacillus idriensis TaxID=324768 RepID=UPI002813E7B9|nr:ring-cleaving dioxygenase [Metabacillus idriensis]MDR0140166.1 ring-cleaving dioxygenase [Metabacillus idriensis]